MLKIENLSKSYGTQALFEGVTVNINRGERVGLVGRNGHGKTTFLRLIAGEETPDSGIITAPRGYRIGHLRQQLDFTESTVLTEAALGLPEEDKDQSWKAEKVLAGLGFSRADMERPPYTFSGGYQVRLNLAKLLVSDPDFLLLDEPTNYLDIVAIRWLERFFRSWRGELLLVTHDRSFMDSVTTHTMGIHRRRIRKMPGDTARYYGQIALEEEVHEKSRINIERKRKQTEEFIRKFRAKARLVGLVQSRIRTLEKQKVPDRLEAIRSMDFNFRLAPMESKVIIQCRDLGYRWSSEFPELFAGLDLTVGRGDRIAVVGPNGKGKSTFLRVLAGELEPGTGTVGAHGTARMGFYGQTNVERLEPNRTVVEELVAGDPDRSVQKARGVAGTMMFEGDAALKKISVLSGGEKSRVLLGRLLLEPHNLLLLDEPTNHLDMDSCEALLSALVQFEGAVVIVTHNEMFLHSLAQRLVVFDRGRSAVFEGTYRNFLDEVGWESEELPDTGTRGHGDTEKLPKGESKKEARKEKARLLKEKARDLAPLKEKTEGLEREVRELELEVEKVNEELIAASNSGDGDAIASLSKQLSELKDELERNYEELFGVTEELERLEQEWSEKL
ncbi:MAG: ABC-F family ATP-binding cassette domain-containing protein [bacterium]|nr:ABC-F family ATP-binding cassette domain-containing protein [bacterium]